jgi:hypothetical protein
MDNVVKFPDVSDPDEWNAKLLDRLIAKGYLQHRQRHDWHAVERAIDSAYDAGYLIDGRLCPHPTQPGVMLVEMVEDPAQSH